MSLVILLLSICCIIGYSLGSCLEATHSSGLSSLVSFKLFTNGSLAILDSRRKYWIFDSSGSAVWEEQLILRDSLSTMQPPTIVGATISETGVIHLLTKDKLTYMYAQGRASKPYTSAVLDTNLKQAKQINIVQGCVLLHDRLGFRLFQVFADGLKDDTSLADQTCEATTTVGQHYVSRVSGNALLNEYYVTAKTNTLVIGKVFPTASGSLRLQPSTSELAALAYTHTIGVAPDTNQIITSSAGANQYFFAYAGFFNYNQISIVGRQTDHKLVLVLRSDTTVNVQKIIYRFYIHSIALHPTNNVIYLYSNRGELFKQEFTYSGGILTFTALTQLSKGLFAKYVELEVISSSLLILKNSISLATYDISEEGPDLKVAYEVKPQWSRHVVGQNFMFLIYHCQYALMFDTTTHSVLGVFKAAKIRDILISHLSANAANFHVLTDASVETYNTASLTLVVSKSFAQIQTDIKAIYPDLDQVHDVVDMDRLKSFTGQVALLLNAKMTNGSEGVLVILMTELFAPLGLDALRFIPTTIAYYGLLTNTVTSTNTLMIHLIGPNVNFQINWDGFVFSSIVTTPSISQMSATNEGISCFFGPTQTCAKMQYQMLAKSTEVEIPSAVRLTVVIEGQRHSMVGANSASSMKRFFNILPSSGWTLTDRMLGNFKGIASLISSENELLKLSGSFLTSGARLTSTDSIFGIPYQTADNSLYITAGHSYHLKVDKPSCFTSGSNSAHTIVVNQCSAQTAGCLYCNFVDEKCEVCASGYVLTASQTCIAATCSSQLQYKSPPSNLCVKTCPIGQYKYVSPTSPTGENLCVTSTDCASTYSYRMFGDRCVTDTCPAGTTDIMSQCTLSNPTTAFSDVSTTIVSICPAGKKYWEHYKQCTDPANLPTANYQQSATTIYCDSSTHYFDYSSRTCTTSCSDYIGLDPTVGKYCIGATDCISGSVWSNYLDETLSPYECVTNCVSKNLLMDVQNKKCVIDCPLGSFKQESTLSCITKAQCTAQTSMTYPSLATCVPVGPCSATYSWDPTNLQCLTSVECFTLNLLLVNSLVQCLPSCPIGTYLHTPTKSCITDFECLSLSSNQLVQQSPNVCLQVPDCLSQGKKIIFSSKVCQSACEPNLFLDSTSSNCYTTTECNALGFLTLSLNSTCISTCPSSAKYQQNGQCVTSCALNKYIEEYNNTCVSQCRYHTSADNLRCIRYIDFADADCIYDVSSKSLDISVKVFFEDSPTQAINSLQNPRSFIDKICTGYSSESNATRYCTSGSLLSVEFSNSSLRVHNSQFAEVEAYLAFVTTAELDNVYVEKHLALSMNRLLECKIKKREYTKEQDSSSLNKSTISLSTPLDVTRVALPFLLATSLDPVTGGVVCLVAHTYMKLTMMSYLNFDLKNNSFSLMYYGLFRSFFDGYNEKLTASIFGWKIINLNKAFVCEAGYQKFCELTVEDSFFIGHLLEFLVLTGEVLLVLAIKGTFRLVKYKKGYEYLNGKSKKKMVFAFLFGNGISLWFSLILGSHIPRFDHLVLGILKGLGLLLLVAYLSSAALVMVRQTSIERWSRNSPSRARAFIYGAYSWISGGVASVFEKVALEGSEHQIGRYFILHDIIISAILVPALHAGKLQIWLWTVGEAAILYLMVRKRFYRSTLLLVRQVCVEAGFLLLSTLLAVFKTIDSNHLAFSKCVFSLSIIILGIDSIFVFFTIGLAVVRKFRGTNKQVEGLSAKSSFRKKARSKTTKNTLTPGNRLVTFIHGDGRADISPSNQSALLKKSSWMKGEESASWDKNTFGNSTATRSRHLKSSTILENVDSPLKIKAAHADKIKSPSMRKPISRFTVVNQKMPLQMTPQSATVRMRFKVKTELGSPSQILKKLKTSRDSML